MYTVLTFADIIRPPRRWQVSQRRPLVIVGRYMESSRHLIEESNWCEHRQDRVSPGGVMEVMQHPIAHVSHSPNYTLLSFTAILIQGAGPCQSFPDRRFCIEVSRRVTKPLDRCAETVVGESRERALVLQHGFQRVWGVTGRMPGEGSRAGLAEPCTAIARPQSK